MGSWRARLRAHEGWVIVAAGGALGCVAIGALFSLPVLLRPIAQDTGWSATGVSGAMTVAFLALAAGSLGWGHLSDRLGPRPVLLAGSALLALGLALASVAPSLAAFQALFGGLAGLGAAAIFAPLMACVTGWFDTRRSLAVSLVSAGMGMAPMTMSPLVAWLVEQHPWRTALQLLALLAAVTMLPLAARVRRAPALAPPAVPAAAAAAADATPGAGAPSTPAEAQAPGAGQVLRSAPFLVLAATSFFSCATHSGPIFHTVSYALVCGIPLMAAVSIYSLEGLAGLGGRLVFGLLGDRFGAARVLVIALLAQALVALAYLQARSLGSLYAVAALFGFTYAGVMPLFAVLAREHFPLRILGTVIGGTTMASSLGMALGPVLGGLLYDRHGSYAGLFVGAFVLGLCAFGCALAFTRLPRPPALSPVG
ncbi:MFS transporter [Piscinibacter sakaiensis]|uniref:Oxalate/formate antiporter n=1 Tax=Piscinibacter sakaiensis TaxID=1547922 RepID=A0A0K8P5F9_PISS1|nr:MFS transporter [Piscinibacter sakaiensis]GAP37847.1 oxalate/formate antiporter [Piscinibacter sakaiensis]